PCIAMAVCCGSAFLAAQLAVSLVFRVQVTCLQWFGIILIICGLAVVTVAKKTPRDGKPENFTPNHYKRGYTP
ncbi:MAG: hypothetical protein PHV82_18900, partial [Victivallaceae bacterium]|nr:hypothetical protein [Victivallaceae bacterium]